MPPFLTTMQNSLPVADRALPGPVNILSERVCSKVFHYLYIFNTPLNPHLMGLHGAK
jgi:hypothetical protein